MKLPLLVTFSQMLPVLQSQESMLRATEIALGTGALKKSAATKIMQEWEKQGNVVRELDPQKVSPALARARIEALGFKVIAE